MVYAVLYCTNLPLIVVSNFHLLLSGHYLYLDKKTFRQTQEPIFFITKDDNCHNLTLLTLSVHVKAPSDFGVTINGTLALGYSL